MSIRISHSHIKQSCSVKQYSYSENKNFPTRQYMQDNFIALDNFPQQKTGLFAILDGHGGAKVSEYCVDAIPRIFEQEYLKNNNKGTNVEKIFTNVCKRVDDELVKMQAEDVGTTCCLVFVGTKDGKRFCTVGNLGDTRAVLLENGKERRVTVDHKVSNQKEYQRIKSQGGCILQGRVGGQLAITRALGDLAFKQIGASNIPETQQFQISQATELLIIASDGLWDVCQDQKAIELIKDMNSTKQMSRILMQYATKNGSKDNISVLVIKF